MANLYRDKIQMMFVKPIVIQEYMLITQEKSSSSHHTPSKPSTNTPASNNQDVIQPVISVQSCSSFSLVSASPAQILSEESKSPVIQEEMQSSETESEESYVEVSSPSKYP
jgi:hypothetical protein